MVGVLRGNLMSTPTISSWASRRWYLTVTLRWHRWQSAVSGLYYRRVQQPLQWWHAAGRSFGQPMPRLPWWHQLVYRYLLLTGWRW